MEEHRLGADQAGRRIDRILKEGWPDVPLGARMKALRIGLVRLEGRRLAQDTIFYLAGMHLGSQGELISDRRMLKPFSQAIWMEEQACDASQ